MSAENALNIPALHIKKSKKIQIWRHKDGNENFVVSSKLSFMDATPCFLLPLSDSMYKQSYNLRLAIGVALIAALMSFASCTSPKRFSDFDLQEQMKQPGERSQLLLSGAKHVDSADVQRAVFDVYNIETTDFPKQIHIHARVFDSAGNFITHLAPPYREDSRFFSPITEKIRKKIYPIQDFSVREFGDKDSLAYSIVLAADYSGSMKGVVEVLKQGTELFVSLKQKQDRIAIASFNKEFSLKVPLWTDKEIILNKYRSVANEGFGYYSAVYDAAMASIQLLKDSPPEIPRLVVLFSDGDDNTSKTQPKALLDSASKHNVRIFSVAFGYSNDQNLKLLSEYSGGKFYRAYSKKELLNIFLDIYRSLRNYYLITYKPPYVYSLHNVRLGLDLPGRIDTLRAEGKYDKTIIGPFDGDNGSGDMVSTSLIFFDFAKAALRPESMAVIEGLVDYMERFPRTRLEVRGHTDNTGSDEFNKKLSQERAESVSNAMIGLGIEPKRLRARGFGMTQPVSSNDSEEGRQKNRRTEFVKWAE